MENLRHHKVSESSGHLPYDQLSLFPSIFQLLGRPDLPLPIAMSFTHNKCKRSIMDIHTTKNNFNRLQRILNLVFGSTIIIKSFHM